MDWNTIIEGAIAFLTTTGIIGGTAVSKKSKNHRLTLERRLTKLEVENKVTFKILDEMKDDIHLIKDYLINGKGKK